MKYRVKPVNLRIRNGPSLEADTVGQLYPDTPITSSYVIDKWVMIGAGLYVSEDFLIPVDEEDTQKIPPVKPDPEPMPTPPIPPRTWKLPFTAVQRGVHASAGGWPPTNDELALVKHNKVEVVLIVAYEANQARMAIQRFRSVGVKHFIIRAATHAEIKDANDFAQRTVPILREYAAALGGSDDMMIAVHNEPNIKKEGFSSAWRNGGEFGGWFTQVEAIYRAELPGCKIGFPALSPGAAVVNVRGDEETFAKQARAAMLSADWIGVHYYWVKEDGSDIHPLKSRWQELYGGRPLVGTEVGPSDDTKITVQAVRKMYEWGAVNNIPIMSWLLNGTERFPRQEWISNGILL